LVEIRKIQANLEKIVSKELVFMLVVPGPEGSITPEARTEPWMKLNSNSNFGAIGIVTKLLHQRILGTLYFKFKKAKYSHYKLFKSEEKAKEWLLQQKSIKVKA
jgi:hypothetical protein